uniref:Kinesin motor domain-containing protein n=1 Tax=Chromera velia CCMP2878 TaxID=1169474 RepID=A0A0G4G4X7_9ALVE|eukprot:Cvel_20274.t1-p1 / transcript=Cvel_20274.t1 / gene=Cvel_20274 / organism=Chromera_velia_CCMP2878 / gene_product=Kinesin-like protein KIF6, putative / transcript_product=Kinesin-like protein KIF6, putative / location=Cvel_scaffold1809:3399-9988(-) / protein_length=714 / sequence_SO=supercontig / SO=protein_coding / is_pseudo=false
MSVSEPAEAAPPPPDKDGNIKVFLRVRPTVSPSKTLSLKEQEGQVEIQNLPDAAKGFVNNTKALHRFHFDGILGMRAKQPEIFDRIAVPIIHDVMEGINGTVFAYGQTGSGKTFTITGGTERYEDRGLIPRTLSYLFAETKKRTDATFKIFISYLEIYQEKGYDLLTTGEAETRNLEELPRVKLREDEEGNMHLRNLTVNQAESEEEALNLVLSACGSLECDRGRRSSERPAALTWHYTFLSRWAWLEGGGKFSSMFIIRGQVIVALHQQAQAAIKSRNAGGAHAHPTDVHVPYRNSLLTSVLRDSLGGNCKTVMISTVAADGPCIEETMSTCRFAQSVAQIRNKARVNEEVDPLLMIKRLKREVKELRAEIAALKGGETPEGPLTDIDRDACREAVEAFVRASRGSSSSLSRGDAETVVHLGEVPSLALSTDQRKAAACFLILREMVWRRQQDESGEGSRPDQRGDSEGALVKKLREEIASRDKEIAILVQLINQREGAKGQAQNGQLGGAVLLRGSAARPDAPTREGGGSRGMNPDPRGIPSTAVSGEKERETAGGRNERGEGEQRRKAAGSSNAASMMDQQGFILGVCPRELRADRRRAAELYWTQVRGEAHERYKSDCDVLRELYSEAKGLGEAANNARSQVEKGRQELEKMRFARAIDMEGAHIERLQLHIKHQRQRLDREFEDWFGSIPVDMQGAGSGPHEQQTVWSQ